MMVLEPDDETAPQGLLWRRNGLMADSPMKSEGKMPVTKEMLRAMIETFGGLDMTDEELEMVLPQVQLYADQAAKLQELDLSEVFSGRLLRADEGTVGS